MYIQLKELLPDRVRFISLPGQQFRQIVEIDGRFRVAIYICRAVNSTRVEEPGWQLRVRPLEKEFPALICTVDQAFSKLLNFYVFSAFMGSIPKYRVFREGQPWLSAARKLGKLDDFCDIAREVASQFESEHYTSVGDILIAGDTWMIVLDKKEIMLGPVGSAMFRMLALNAGQVVSRDRLGQVSPTLLDPHNLNSQISRLRVKLGAEARKRIQTVPGVGYMDVSPDKSVGRGSEGLSERTI